MVQFEWFWFGLVRAEYCNSTKIEFWVLIHLIPTASQDGFAVLVIKTASLTCQQELMFSNKVSTTEEE